MTPNDDNPTEMVFGDAEFSGAGGAPPAHPLNWEWNSEVRVRLPEADLGGRRVKGLTVVARDLVAFDAAREPLALKALAGTLEIAESSPGVGYKCWTQRRVTFRCPDDRTYVTIESVCWGPCEGKVLRGTCRLVSYGRLNADGSPPPGVTHTSLDGAPSADELAAILAGGVP